MKRFLVALALFCLVFVTASLSPRLSYAIDPLDSACAQTPDSPACDRGDGSNPISGSTGLVRRVAVVISIITGVASIILIIIGGIKYVTSGGDPNSVNSAKNTVMYAVVGVIITLSAQAIIIFVINKT